MKSQSIEEFLKPDQIKVLLLFLLTSVGFIFGFISALAVSTKIPVSKRWCQSTIGVAETLAPNVFTFAFLPFIVILFGTICNWLILFLANLPYLYLLSCLITWISRKI